MKKALLGVLSTAIVFSMCATTAFAAGPGGGRYFVDADGDGICDNCEAYHWCGDNFVDIDGDGVCDNYAAGQGRGTGRGGNFVDTDGDGVCDNYGSGQSQGRGCGYGRGGHCGRGNGFRGVRGW